MSGLEGFMSSPVPSGGYHGRLCPPESEVNLKASALIVEMFVPAKGDVADSLVASYVVIDGLDPVIAQEAVTFFWGMSHLLVDVDALRADIGVGEEISARIMWTDNLASFIGTMHEFGILREIPPPGIVNQDIWALHAAYVHDGMKLLIWPSQVHALMSARLSGDPSECIRALAPTPARIVRDASAGRDTRVIVEGLAEDTKSDPLLALWRPLSEALPLEGPAWLVSDEASEPLADLRARVPWMSDVIDIVEQRLWVLRSVGRSWAHLTPLLLHGPSGCGKSYFAKLLATALGVGFAEISLAGSTDNRDMEGTARGWTNFRPSWPVKNISHIGAANPLLFVDEVDKVDSGLHGDPRRTLLTMLDPKTARRYPDTGLGRPADISAVSWLFAANEVQGLDTAFRDRVQIVSVRSPSAEHLPAIVEGVLVDMAEDLGVHAETLPRIGQTGMSRIVAQYREHRSLRQVSRTVRDMTTRIMVADARSASTVRDAPL